MVKNIPTETLRQYYERTGLPVPADLLDDAPGKPHFVVRETGLSTRRTPFNRRDYYKICLSSGVGKGSGFLIYNNQEIQINQPCLIFSHPSVPCSIEINATQISRYHILFNQPFIQGHIPPDLQYACALFNASLHPVIPLSIEQRDRLSMYFREMQTLQQSDYPFKGDMVRSLLKLLIHEGVRLQQKTELPPAVMKDRLVNGFLTLLNEQFPVDSPENALKLLTPAHFAGLLHVHVNHLNHTVKKHTGKSTSNIIHERVVTEAKALLHNTNWNIAEIAYALGFEYPSHFNKYFKKFTAATPLEFRAGQQKALATQL